MIEKITFPYYDRGNIDGQCIQPTETVQSVHVYEGTDGGPGSHSDIEADYCIYVFATDTSCLGKVDKMHPYVAGEYLSSGPSVAERAFLRGTCINGPSGNYGPTTFDDVASLVIRKVRLLLLGLTESLKERESLMLQHACPADEPSLIPL